MSDETARYFEDEAYKEIESIASKESTRLDSRFKAMEEKEKENSFNFFMLQLRQMTPSGCDVDAIDKDKDFTEGFLDNQDQMQSSKTYRQILKESFATGDAHTAANIFGMYYNLKRVELEKAKGLRPVEGHQTEVHHPSPNSSEDYRGRSMEEITHDLSMCAKELQKAIPRGGASEADWIKRHLD